MFILSRAFNLFKVQADTDLSEASAFKSAFSNVVNLLMLVQSLILGLHTLISEDSVLSYVNLVFSLFFVTYFVVTYIVRLDKFVNTIDRIAIFLYFIVVYITCAKYAIVGVTISIYPFIAIILHGRHVGAILSFIQSGIVLAYYFFATSFLSPEATRVYSLEGTLTIFFLQIISVFIYYVAVRWLSGLVYDKNREVAILNEELRNQRDLTDRLAQCVDKPLRDISEASAIMVGERLNPMQTELSSIIRSSSLNAINNVNSVRKSTQLSIPIVPAEFVKFNIYSMLGGMLKLYRPQDPQYVHNFALGHGVPEVIKGNSILTRQIFLNIFDAIDSRMGLTKCDMKISVSREDALVNDVVLRFSIQFGRSIEIDRREVVNGESFVVDAVGLGVTKRIVESEGGSMTVTVEDKKLRVEFTIKYYPVTEDDEVDSEVLRAARASLNASLPMRLATLMVVTANDNLWKTVNSGLSPYFAQVKRADTVEHAVRVFSNNLIDVVLADKAVEGIRNGLIVETLRDAESGLVRKVPIIGLVSPQSPEQMAAFSLSGFDSCVLLPFDSVEACGVIHSYFD